MSHSQTAEIDYQLLQSGTRGRHVADALEELFAGDGTIYLVVGFFTHNGYQAIRDDILGFLRRDPENALKLVVGPATDQFSARIARDLWTIDTDDQVAIYKYPRGLHAKLYLRDGEHPHVIMGSANLTQVGFKYNVELGIEITGSDPDHPHIAPFIEWVEAFVGTAQPMSGRDLLLPVQLWNSIANWTNKGRLLPRRHVAKRLVPMAVLILVVSFAIALI